MRSLQCIRAVAALLVVYYHTVLQIHHLSDWSGPQPVLFGRCGVDVFFVLSGLLMWRSTRSDRYSPLLFYKKRVARIAPLYWVVTLTAAGTALVIPSMLHSTRFDASHVIASLAFVPWPNPAAEGRNLEVLITPVIVPGWTLNFEMMFYALFGVTLIGPRKRRLGLVVALFTLFIATVVAFGPTHMQLEFYDPFLIVEFLLGVAVAVLIERTSPLPVRWAVFLLVLSGTALIVLDSLSPPVSRLFSLGLPAVAIVYCLATIERAGRWPTLAWLCLLGDASFSIYLTHIFVLAGLRMLWETQIDAGELWALTFLVGAFAGSCVVGVAVYRLVERPLNGVANRVLGLQA